MKDADLPLIVYLPPSLIENDTLDIYTSVLNRKNYDIAIAPKSSISLYLPWKFADLLIPPIIIKESTFWKRLHEINSNLDNIKVRKAYNLSKKIHTGQSRQNDRPYFEEHILPVALYYLISTDLLEKPIEEDILIAALLHDSVEDSNNNVLVYKSDQKDEVEHVILEELFDERICNTIKKLTKIKYEDRNLRNKLYAEQIKESSDAVLIKCIDRILNLASDVEEFDSKKTDKVMRYLNETKTYFLQFFDLVDPYYKKVVGIVIEAIIESNFRRTSHSNATEVSRMFSII